MGLSQDYRSWLDPYGLGRCFLNLSHCWRPPAICGYRHRLHPWGKTGNSRRLAGWEVPVRYPWVKNRALLWVKGEETRKQLTKPEGRSRAELRSCWLTQVPGRRRKGQHEDPEAVQAHEPIWAPALVGIGKGWLGSQNDRMPSPTGLKDKCHWDMFLLLSGPLLVGLMGKARGGGGGRGGRWDLRQSWASAVQTN